MSPTTRRSFLKTGLAAGAMATAGIVPLVAAKRTGTDTVVLGRSKMEVTRLAFGTGTNGGEVQAALGQQEFTRLVRYAYDRGIRFFETAEAYQTPGVLGEALKVLPRNGRPGPNQIPADLKRTIEKPQWMRLEFSGGILVDLPNAEYERQRNNKDWLIEFPADSLRVL